MLTVDYAVLDVRSRHRVLDIGCGGGRHSFEALRQGARVVAADLDDAALKDVAQMGAAMIHEDQAPLGATLDVLGADATRLPFSDGAFDRVIASEVLEHIPDDVAALRELQRVTKAGGTIAVTVPRSWPERVNWMLSSSYHAAAGGHVRIYRRTEVEAKLTEVRFQTFHHHFAHALHSPYWWMRCALGIERETRLTRAYHSFLVWNITKKPRAVRRVEHLLDPLMGKSLVVYARKPR
ncbi:MAG: class I SAM-dependent methyltransferase [Actinomycetota bacterium]|nr:class I SAM-dependent methyltransferase [Actinomycetota bacterium]